MATALLLIERFGIFLIVESVARERALYHTPCDSCFTAMFLSPLCVFAHQISIRSGPFFEQNHHIYASRLSVFSGDEAHDNGFSPLLRSQRYHTENIIAFDFGSATNGSLESQSFVGTTCPSGSLRK